MPKKALDNEKNFICRICGLLEIAVFSFAFFFAWRFGYPFEVFPVFLGKGKYILVGIYAALIFFLFYFNEGFRFGYLKISDAVASQWISLLIVNTITYFQISLIANILIDPIPIVALFGGELAFSLIFIYSFTKLYTYFSHPEKMLMIYGNENSVVLKLKMDTRADKYNVAELISSDIGFERLSEEMIKYDTVVICDVSAEMRNDILKFCYMNGIGTYLTPKLSDIIIKGASTVHLFDTPLIHVRISGLTREQRFLKRAMDIILSFIALIVLSPIMLMTALAIKLEDRGPVLYKQERVTRDSRKFNIIKFRSMIVDAEKDGQARLASKDDDRITRVGRFIRKTRIDEIPQIINILKGEMSIVGPRPERPEIAAEYESAIPEFRFRLNVKAGLTGYAQIFGKYNTSAYNKLMLDLMYIENYSILLDIKLILMTLKILIKKESTEGVSEEEPDTDAILSELAVPVMKE